VSGSLQAKNLLDAIWRRKWFVVIPPIVGLAVSLVMLQRLPRIYQAVTTVLVVSQRLPETYVRTTVTSGLSERLASLKVQILGASYLDRVIEKLKLAPDGAGPEEIERVREALARNIDVPDAGRNASFFQIAVKDKDPELAANVANLLADMFIEENGRIRTAQATATAGQMGDWLRQKKEKLDALEQRVANYRRSYYGELPDQQQTNLQQIGVSQARLNQISDSIAQRRSRIETLRSQIQMAESMASASASSPTASDPALRELQQLEADLAQLRRSYTDQNPDVRKKLGEIEDFKRAHPDLLAAGSAGERPSPAIGTAQAEIRRLENEIAVLEAEQDVKNREIARAQGSLRNVPLREQEISSLTRDRDTLRQEYDEMSRKYQEALRAEDLEQANQAEHFRVQDRAGVPGAPFSPIPAQVIGMGLVLGLALGIGLAFVLERMDPTVRTEEAFKSAFPDLTLLVSIPNLDATPTVTGGPGKRKHRKSTAAVVAGAGALLSALHRLG
jgi:polysaccharide chain length determinant protein (PEP-CTERM system associated)